jgi:hypothetical protein
VATTVDLTLNLGSSWTEQTLRAQAYEPDGTPVGEAITTGFTEFGGGIYHFHGTVAADDFEGPIVFSRSLGEDAWQPTIAGSWGNQTAVLAAGLDFEQPVPEVNPPGSLGEALQQHRTRSVTQALLEQAAEGWGKWTAAGGRLTLYAPDGVTVIQTFPIA